MSEGGAVGIITERGILKKIVRERRGPRATLQLTRAKLDHGFRMP